MDNQSESSEEEKTEIAQKLEAIGITDTEVHEISETFQEDETLSKPHTFWDTQPMKKNQVVGENEGEIQKF